MANELSGDRLREQMDERCDQMWLDQKVFVRRLHVVAPRDTPNFFRKGTLVSFITNVFDHRVRVSEIKAVVRILEATAVALYLLETPLAPMLIFEIDQQHSWVLVDQRPVVFVATNI